MEEQRESVKVSKSILDELRVIAKRDGLVLGPLIDRLLKAGIKAERLK